MINSSLVPHSPKIPGLPNLEEAICRSLKRSATYGVDPHLDGAPEKCRLTEQELRQRIMEQQPFYGFAREQLDTLYKLLKNTGFCMALADREGYVLYVIGDVDLVEHFKRRRCLPGYRWTEKDVGTCAIGLTLHEQAPVFLPGNRMYCAQAKQITNAGAPVFSPTGMLLGVISLSGRSDRMHIHTLGLVRQAAETVTSQLRESEQKRNLAIQNQFMNALIESDSRGIVAVDKEGCIVQTNRKARSLLKLRPEHTGKSFEDCVGEDFGLKSHLKQGKGYQAREFLTPRSGITHFVSLDLIRLADGENSGGLFIIMEKKETMRMALEVTGNQAHFTFDSIIGTSKPLQKAIHFSRIASTSTAPVLLQGETGTGKELFAQSIHNDGERHNKPFVVINCGAIPKELLESELFGYEEGAFTGAQKGGRPGKLELADGGTLFLDEIGDMPFDMQVKLLRVLQTGEIQRVGGLRTIPVDLRIISATNVDLKQAIAHRKFREDLYYRISTLNIVIPPLRERKDDILELVQYFIHRLEHRLNRPSLSLSPETALALQNYSWPGNIRQLESAVERAIHLSESPELRLEYFGLSDILLEKKLFPSVPQQTLEQIEYAAITETLKRYGGNIRKTAEILQISRPTLYRKLRKGQFPKIP